MAGKTYRVRISRGDQQFEAEGDKSFVLQMFKKFETGAEPGPPAKGGGEKPKDPAAFASAKSVSVGEFIRQFGFKKHTDLVLAFGYYLEQHSGMKDFTAADISSCYYEAKLEPSNVSQAIIQNIHRTFMMEAKASKGTKRKGVKSFTLTSSGENHIKKVSAKAK